MGNFDEVRELEKLVEIMDENPEAYSKAMAEQGQPAPEGAEAEPEPEYQQVLEPEAEEGLSGGLSDALEVEEDAPVTLDDILGLDGRGSSPENTEEPAASEAAEPVEAETSGVDERFTEMSKANKELREQVDLLTKRALQEPMTAPVENDDVLPAEDEINSDVDEYFAPYVQKATAPLLAEIEALKAASAPALKAQQDQMMGDAISERVKGFKPENVADLYKELDTMSDQDKAIFGDDFAGAVALAANMVNRGAFTSGKPKQTMSPLAARSHSETSGPAPGPNHSLTDEQKLKRLMEMPGDQFLAQLDKMEQGEY
jgi:hypothetical protein